MGCFYSIEKKVRSLQLPWYAPQNQIPLFPWIFSSSRETFEAATDGMGWLVDHLSKVCLGMKWGFRVTRKGILVEPRFCNVTATRRRLQVRIKNQNFSSNIFLSWNQWYVAKFPVKCTAHLKHIEPICNTYTIVCGPKKIPGTPCWWVLGHQTFVTVKIYVTETYK